MGLLDGFGSRSGLTASLKRPNLVLRGKFVSKDRANDVAFELEKRTGNYTAVKKVKGIYHVYERV